MLSCGAGGGEQVVPGSRGGVDGESDAVDDGIGGEQEAKGECAAGMSSDFVLMLLLVETDGGEDVRYIIQETLWPAKIVDN